MWRGTKENRINNGKSNFLAFFPKFYVKYNFRINKKSTLGMFKYQNVV